METKANKIEWWAELKTGSNIKISTKVFVKLNKSRLDVKLFGWSKFEEQNTIKFFWKTDWDYKFIVGWEFEWLYETIQEF